MMVIGFLIFFTQETSIWQIIKLYKQSLKEQCTKVHKTYIMYARRQPKKRTQKNSLPWRECNKSTKLISVQLHPHEKNN